MFTLFVGIGDKMRARLRSSHETKNALDDSLGVDRLRHFLDRIDKVPSFFDRFRGLDLKTRQRILKFVLMAFATALGFWGFQISPSEQAELPYDPWSMPIIWKNAFRTMQLLTTQFPSDLPTELPLQLQIARFAMPIFAAWITASALIQHANRPLLVFIASRSNRHIVLVGISPVSVGLARSYRALRRPVVAIVPPSQAADCFTMELAGARILVGDPTDPVVLRKAGLHRASAMVSIEDAGTTAVTLASAVIVANMRRAHQYGPLTLLISVKSEELRLLVAGEIASIAQKSRVELRFHVRERAVARSLLGQYPADWGLPPGAFDYHAVILGFGAMGAALLLQLARVAIPQPGKRVILTVVDRGASKLKEQLLIEYPRLPECCEIRFVDADLRATELRSSEASNCLFAPVPATSVYVCCGDDHANISMTIGLRRLYADLRSTPAPIFVYQRQHSVLVDALRTLQGPPVHNKRIIAFGSVEQEADPDYLVEEEHDHLAQLIHQQYLSASPTGPAAVAWPELPETYRSANRSQADFILPKLRQLGMHATTNPTDIVPPATAEVVERLAEQEHDRWCRDRLLSGWVYAPARNDAMRQHPSLLPYKKLDQAEKKKDRDTIINLPEMLRSLGFGLRRDYRIGLWIEGLNDANSATLAREVSLVVSSLVEAADHSCLQLVLPLRSSLEIDIARTLARTKNVGIDLALLENSNFNGSDGAILSNSRALSLICVADRAFSIGAEATSDDDIISAFGRVCDELIIVCSDSTIAQTLTRSVKTSPAPGIHTYIHGEA